MFSGEAILAGSPELDRLRKGADDDALDDHPPQFRKKFRNLLRSVDNGHDQNEIRSARRQSPASYLLNVQVRTFQNVFTTLETTFQAPWIHRKVKEIMQ